ncbi:MAG TPA: PAS domain-containing protein [Tepiditoga sp.]|nr:PAS domain-containing protein [Thermotogota bacterium]HOO74574.1 PAS domain-containing protein [Tepiditoga sp.]
MSNNDITNELKLQILDQIPAPVMAVDKNMKIIYMNHHGKDLLKKEDSEIFGKLCSGVINSEHCNSEKCCMVNAMTEGKPFAAKTVISVEDKKIPLEYHAVPLKNKNGEVVGGLEFALDITERLLYEERLKEQSRTIRQMSTPTIKLWDGVLVLPVVGVVDSIRAQYMMESILNKITETYSKVIILDIHGVAAVDTAVANHLIKITKASRLMGCECILSGISPSVAQTIIHLGIDMTSISTKATLSDALSEAFSILDLEVREHKHEKSAE